MVQLWIIIMLIQFPHNAYLSPSLGKVIRLNDRFIVFVIEEADRGYSDNIFYLLDEKRKKVSQPLITLSSETTRLTTQFAMFRDKLLMVKKCSDYKEINFIVYMDPETYDIQDTIHIPHEAVGMHDVPDHNLIIDVMHMESTEQGFTLQVRAVHMDVTWIYNPYKDKHTYTHLTYEYNENSKTFHLKASEPLMYVPTQYCMYSQCTPMETNMELPQCRFVDFGVHDNGEYLSGTCELLFRSSFQKTSEIEDIILAVSNLEI